MASISGTISETGFNHVVAIIVTYNPDQGDFTILLQSLIPQIELAIIVDNGSSNSVTKLVPNHLKEKIELVELIGNFGIASAQNIGISQAIAKGFRYILLSDQDSVPADNMVSKLLEALMQLEALNYPVAAVGPHYIDKRQRNRSPFIQIRGLQLVRLTKPTIASRYVEVDFLIASGSLIPASVFDVVGKMRGELFIDYVDIEWCFRAKSFGFQCFGDFDAQMCHQLGENPIRIFGRAFPVHHPRRHFYMLRNAIWLYKLPYIPFKLKVIDAFRQFVRHTLCLIVVSPRKPYLINIYKGFFAGLSEKTNAECL